MLRYYLLLVLIIQAESLRRGFLRCPLVSSPAGIYRGKVLPAKNGLFFNSFRGIPYAKKPIGDLRFAKPQDLDRLKGIVNARDFGPNCIQPIGFVGGRGQEDCLTLNVYTPRRSRRSFNRYYRRNRRRRLKKVMVFAHGGGGVAGSSREYIPGDFVTTQNILVVTFNYRLGFLGFLRGNSDELPGNQNIRDALKVLEWVQRNIRSFGGNPNKVTYAGQGTGGYIGGFLSISPLAKGLFNNAIFMGGGFIGPYPYPPRTSNDLLERVIDMFDECRQPGQSLDVELAVDCLKNLPALAFDTQFSLELFRLIFSSHDDILPGRPQDLWSDPDYLDAVGFSSRNYLLEVAKDGGLFSFHSRQIRLDISTPEQTEISLAEALNRPVSVVADRILPRYRALSPGDDREAVNGFFTDFFRNASALFLESFSNATDGTSTPGHAYEISFDQEPSYIPNLLFPRTLELVYLFDLTPERALEITYPRLSVEGTFTKEEQKLRQSFINLVADFVRNGDPGRTLRRKSKVNWPPYDLESKFYLSFSSQPELDQDLQNRRFRVA